jgi:translocation and assembly module TamB
MKRLTIGVLTALLVLAAFGYLLLATDVGLTWLVRVAERSFDQLKVGRAAGSVLHGFSLQELNYRMEDMSVDVREIEVEWQPKALPAGTLQVDAVRLEGVRIVQSEATAKPPESTKWPDLHLPLEVVVNELLVLDASWQTSETAEPIRFERIEAALNFRDGRITVERLDAKTPEAKATISGTLASAEQPPIELDTAWRLTLPNRPGIEGAGTITGGLDRISIVQRISTPTPMSVTADVAIGVDAIAWSAEVDLPEFPLDRIDPGWEAWPFSAHLKGEGSRREAKVAGNFALGLPEVGRAEGRLDLNYRDPGELELKTLALVLLETGTEAVASGQVRNVWETPEFALKARWKNLLWPPQPDAEWRSPEGRLAASGTRNDVRVKLDGRIKDQRVEASGNIGFPADGVVFRNVRVNSASTVAAIDGTWGARSDLRWSLESRDLGVWLPGAEGRVRSKGRLEGTLSAPAVEAELNAAGIKFSDYGARDLSLTLKAGSEPKAPLIFDLRGNAVRVDAYTADVGLSARGSRERHGLTGRIESSPYALAFEAEGGVRENAWSGRLSRFEIKEPRTGTWMLRDPAGLKLAGVESGIEELCLRNRDALWCLQGNTRKAGEWWISTRVSGFPFSILEKQAPKAAPISGVLNGSAAFSGKNQLIEKGLLELGAEGVAFDIRIEPSKKVRIMPETASLYADLAGRSLAMQLKIRQAGLAEIQGNFESRGPFRLTGFEDLPVSGHLTANLETLAVFEPWLEEIEGLKGSLTAEVGIDGTAGAPRLGLRASVTDAGFRVPQLGIAVEPITLQASSLDQQQIRLEGSAQSGGGSIRLSGFWRLGAGADRPLTLNLDGTRFLGIDTPEARVLLSPNIDITADRQRIDIRGRVDVPEAQINVPEKEQAVTPSEDVVLIDGRAGKSETGFKVHGGVEIRLGDKIQVKAAGFRGRVDGKVNIVQEPGEEARGTGQIVVHDGIYSFYGTDLTIDEGRLLFTNSPVDNPGLDVLVTRQLGEVVAGVRALGSLKKPNVTLYSRPPLPDADILAYLVAGKPLDFTPREDGDKLRDAASALGGAAGSLLAREITSRFGLGGILDEIGIGAPRGTESTSLFLGKYLTPRLYLQYGLGLFQSSNTVRLRYKLNKHWRLQSETGEESGADVLFEWEK